MITLSNPSSKNQPKSKSAHKSEPRKASRGRPDLKRARKELESLSNKKLLSNLAGLNHKERKLKAIVLLYLSELERRKLYLPLGFSSLFDLCTYHLGYTKATAFRRIRAARAALKYPEALDMLLSGEINITTLSIVTDILDDDNRREILAEIRGKSTRQVEALVSRHRPERVSRDSVRPVCVMRRLKRPGAGNAGSGAEGSRTECSSRSGGKDSQAALGSDSCAGPIAENSRAAGGAARPQPP